MCFSCSSKQPGLLDFVSIRDFDGRHVEIEHPGGPIDNPDIPPELAREAAERPDAQILWRETVKYSVKHEFRGGLDKALQKEISNTFKKTSMLEKMRKDAPTGVAGLDQRMRSDLSNAYDVLHAYGFYTGKVSGRLRRLPPRSPDETVRRYEVLIIFRPGVRYNIGDSGIMAAPDEFSAASVPPGSLPKTLEDVGLKSGLPVVADDVLSAVSGVRHAFRNNGYPFAELAGSRYFLDHDQRTLETEIIVISGEEVRMGELELRGPAPVRSKYFRALQTWKTGRLWNQDLIDLYRDNLRQTGLFASVEVYPSESLNERGERNVVVEVVGGLERTIGGALRYDSDLGLGVLAYWEHRNISGRGDKLRIEAPVWEEMQEVAASYRLPFFKRPDRDLIMGGGILHEDNDSYKLLTASGAIGVERRFNRRWSGNVRVRGEGGRIEEVDKPERGYYMFGLPVSLTFNDTRNPLDATKGIRITAAGAPYGGYYEDYFSAVRTRFDSAVFLPVVGEDTLVVALRGVYGSLFGASSEEVPPTIRFYSGGGGSVRGYEYRSLGPRNDDNDPLGGESLVECSAELRWKFTDEMGLVLFTDGGMVYADKYPGSESLRWGAGLGFRYYTLLGPVRFDVAFPVNKREDDSSVQLYISIGQSF